MPTTINGVGTTYIGKRSVHQYPGVCSSCNAQIMLEDYETTLFFTFIYIPLIPLGRKQIIGHCQSCTRHQAMSVDDWNRIKEEAISNGLVELEKDPNNPQTALAMIGTYDGFHDRESALDLAAVVQSLHKDDPDVQLELGAWYEQSQLETKANECFDRAFELDPEHPGAIRARGITCLEQGQIEEAHALLEKLLPPSPAYDPVVFFMLGSAYQERHQHDQALKLFALIEENSPEWRKDKAFRKAFKKSKKAVG